MVHFKNSTQEFSNLVHESSLDTRTLHRAGNLLIQVPVVTPTTVFVFEPQGAGLSKVCNVTLCAWMLTIQDAEPLQEHFSRCSHP